MKTTVIQKLGFEGFLINTNDVPFRYPEYSDITKIGADSVYFSSDRPAVLFLNVNSFDDEVLKRISVVHHNAWNYQRVLLLYVSSDTEIRIYNCFEKPINPYSTKDADKQLNSIELYHYSVSSIYEDLTMLEKLFSRINVDSGTIWTADVETRNRIRKDHRVDAFLIECMSKAANKLQSMGLPPSVIHSLLIRSLFIQFLEDKGASKDAGLYDSIKPGAKDYFELLDDKKATYRLFYRLQEQFNGNITMMTENEESYVNEKHLEVIKDCFLDGDFTHQPQLFDRSRLFNFEIIHIGLISEIYENFLGEYRNKKGQFYTSFALTDMILSEVLPTSSDEYNYPLLDFSCGSGIFLVESYKRLINRWKSSHKGQSISFETLEMLLKNNIFGIEIDETAIRVSAFSLYLTLIDQLDPKTLWNSDNHQLPYLIYDPDDPSLANKQGRNLWRRNTISEVDADSFPQIKLLIGNPPFGTKDLSPEIRQYCQREKFALEYVLPFMHKATQFCPNGEIALIFTAKVLFNTGSGYARFRQWLFNENSVRRIDNLSIFRKAHSSYGGSLFASASCPVCVAYYTAKSIDKQSTVSYYSPKTFIKSNLIDGLVIDESDVNILPIRDCQNPNSNIWKVASWGNYYGYQLIDRLSRFTLGNYFITNGWVIGRGLNSDSKNPDFIPSPIVDTEYIARYYTNLTVARVNKKKRFRKVKDGQFEAPYVVFKQGQHDGEIACSLFMEKVFCTSTATILNGGTLEDKKILTAYLNSKLAKYFLLLTTSSWGIEREQIYTNEVLNIPSPFEGLSADARRIIVECFDEIYSLSCEVLIDINKIQMLEGTIEEQLERALNLTKRDGIYINDTLQYNFGIFQKGIEAPGYQQVLEPESKDYADTLYNSLSRLTEGTKLSPQVVFFEGSSGNPLQMVVLDLLSNNLNVTKGDSDTFKQVLKRIDNYLLERQSESVYMRRTLKYFDGSRIILIKPNQKRFWSKMQAYDDAASIINDIMCM